MLRNILFKSSGAISSSRNTKKQYSLCLNLGRRNLSSVAESRQTIVTASDEGHEVERSVKTDNRPITNIPFAKELYLGRFDKVSQVEITEVIPSGKSFGSPRQGRRRRSGAASAGPLFGPSMLPAVSLFLVLAHFTSDFIQSDAIINNACCMCHQLRNLFLA